MNRKKIVTMCIFLLFVLIMTTSSSAIKINPLENFMSTQKYQTLATHNNLTFIVKTDKEEYKLREPVQISLQLTNTGNENITITTPDARTYDFIVLNSLWHKRYQLSDGKGFAQVITETTIPAGKTIYYNETWNQKGTRFTFMPLILRHQVRAGYYRIIGLIPQMDFEEMIATTIICIVR